jgi:hypothetical protein
LGGDANSKDTKRILQRFAWMEHTEI